MVGCTVTVPVHVHGLPIDCCLYGSISLVKEKDVEEMEKAILLYLHCKLDVLIDAVEVVVK